jgi:hypothetical protein
MGTSDYDVLANYEYPLAFQSAFVELLESSVRLTPFRFICLSGKFVERDPSKKLYFLDNVRKLKVFHHQSIYGKLLNFFG